MPTPYSALVITHDRDDHLLRTVAGLVRQEHQPSEIVVVLMNQQELPTLPTSVPVTTLHIDRPGRLPLAEARNAAAAHASHDTLVFLDVDCIPDAGFATQLLRDLDHRSGLVMGTPMYLPSNWPRTTNDPAAFAREHPARSQLTPGPCEDFTLFWSLCFAMSASDFATVGGFDERYVGYGGEDTDFALSSQRAGLGFSLSTAAVFHQFHESYRPPLNHFDDIVSNATSFHAKWGRWPMDGWLRQFADLGLIEWNSSSIDVCRSPSSDEIDAARSADLFA